MTFDVRISHRAEGDLRGIFEYIAFDLKSMSSAERQLSRIERRLYELAEFPFRYRAYEKEPWRERGLRVMAVDNYLALYIPNQDAHVVDVLRVIYGGRDVDALLSGPPSL